MYSNQGSSNVNQVKRLLILGVAYRKTHYCVGGRELSEYNKFGDGVRIVSCSRDSTFWGLSRDEIKIEGMNDRIVKKLDIVDVELAGRQENRGMQPENWVWIGGNWKLVGELDMNSWRIQYMDEFNHLNPEVDRNEFAKLIDDPESLWNLDGAITGTDEDAVTDLPSTSYVLANNFAVLQDDENFNSVLMIRPRNLYYYTKDSNSYRVKFDYKDAHYNLPLTDVEMKDALKKAEMEETPEKEAVTPEFRSFPFEDNCLLRLSLMMPLRPARHAVWKRFKLVGSILEYND